MSLHRPLSQTVQEALVASRETATACDTAEETHTPHSTRRRMHRQKSIAFELEPRRSKAEDTNTRLYPLLDSQKAAYFYDEAGVQPPDPLPPGPSPYDVHAPSPEKTLSNCSEETAVGGNDLAASPRGNSNLDHGLAERGRFMARPDGSVAHVGGPASSMSSQLFTGGLSMQDAIERLVPIDMSDSERYKGGYTYPLNYSSTDTTIIASGLATSFASPTLPEEGWTAYVHPEGRKYFYYNTADAPVPVITEAWIYDNEIFGQVKHYMAEIFKFMDVNGIEFPSNSDASGKPKQANLSPEEGWSYFQDHAPVVLVLDVRLSGNSGYYFVHHAERRLFWLDEYDFTWCVGEVHVNHTLSSIGLEMTSQYWRHIEAFPHLYEFTQTDLERMSDMIGFTFGDVFTSDTSAVNMHTLDELKHAQDFIVRHGQKTPSQRKDCVGERKTICRVVGDLYHQRFLNLHGERGARLDSRQSIHYSEHRRKKWVKRADVVEEPSGNRSWYQRFLPISFFSKQGENGDEMICVEAEPEPSSMAMERHSSSLFMRVASIVMFGGPSVHAKKLREIALDQIINKKQLAKYTEKVEAEWRDASICATVLLTANVSFLAIQSVDEASEGQDPRTPAQLASYFSILACLGSMVSSVVLVILMRHREVMGHKLIGARSASRWGLEALALMYGTPSFSLIMGILGFFISFALVLFGPEGAAVKVIFVGCVLSFVVFLVWAVWVCYSEAEPYQLLAQKAASGVRMAACTVRKGTLDMAKTVRKGSVGMVSVTVGRWPTLTSPGNLHQRKSLSQEKLPQYAPELSSEPQEQITDAKPSGLV